MSAPTAAAQMPTHQVDLGTGATGWFTGRGPRRNVPERGAIDRRFGTHLGNLSHYRPHRPDELAASRAAVGRAVGVDPSRWHLMRQVHSASVAVIDDRVGEGAVSLDVDALVTAQPGRVLGVSVADCVPVLVAGVHTCAAIHAGRRGVELSVVAAAVETAVRLGERPETLVAAIGPAIEGCCYEVPERLRDLVAEQVPAAAAMTTWGTASLDLVAAVRSQLADAGVSRVTRTGTCTRCTPGWFSHRANPNSGRQFGLVLRSGERELA